MKHSIDLTADQHRKRRQVERYLFLLLVFLLTSGIAKSQNWDWAQKAGTVENWETGMGVATDSSGNVYTTGFVQGSAFALPGFGFEDVFLAKYDANGTLLWVTKCGGSDSDHGQGIAIDNSGSIYITGSFKGNGTFKSASPSTVSLQMTSTSDWDAYIAKYDPNGVLQWVTKVGSNFGDEEGTAIAVDQAGGVYVTGYLEFGEGDFYDAPGSAIGPLVLLKAHKPAIFLAKYTNTGTCEWAKGVESPGSNRGNGIAVNSGGTKIVVTGAFQASADFGNSVKLSNSASLSDIFVVAYDGTGKALWAQQGGGTSSDAGLAVAIDNADNVYVTGTFSDVATFYNNPATPSVAASSKFPLISNQSNSGSFTIDIVLAKYDQSGAKQWITGPGGKGSDYAYGLVLDGPDVVITGFFEYSILFNGSPLISAGNFDVFVARFNRTSGGATSSLRAGGLGSDGGRGIAAGNFGVTYVTGAFQSNPAAFGANTITNTGGSEDVFVAKVNSNFVSGTDLYIQDAPNDVGDEPDTQAAVLWASPDIWVRNIKDVQTSINPPRFQNEHNHQNPEYATIPSNTPWIYTKTRNRGSTPVSGTLHIYWANASLGLNWPTDWQEVPPTSANTITNFAPGGVWVVALQWTSIPLPSLSEGGHFCLLARFEPAISTPDPIVGEVLNDGIWRNVFNSNNIAWKNVTVVNNDKLNRRPNPGSQVLVHNIRNQPTLIKLSLDSSSEDFDRFTRFGTINLDLGQRIFDRWSRGGMVGAGVKHLEGTTTLSILAPNAWLGNIQLDPNEESVVGVRFELNSHPQENVEEILNFDLVQYEIRPTMGGPDTAVLVGGERFEIELGRKTNVIESSGPPSDIQTKPTTFDDAKIKALNPAGVALPEGVVTIPYSQTFTATGGCSSSFAYSVTRGVLPHGLALSPNGVLSGMATQPGVFTFSVTVTDSCRSSLTQTYTLKVQSATNIVKTKTLVISAFRENGPNGAGDEFIEIFNPSDRAVTVSDLSSDPSGHANGIGVFSNSGSDAGTGRNGVFLRCHIPGTAVIKARSWYLCGGHSYSLSNLGRNGGTTHSVPDRIIGTGNAVPGEVPDDAGLVLLNVGTNIVTACAIGSSNCPTGFNFSDMTGARNATVFDKVGFRPYGLGAPGQGGYPSLAPYYCEGLCLQPVGDASTITLSPGSTCPAAVGPAWDSAAFPVHSNGFVGSGTPICYGESGQYQIGRRRSEQQFDPVAGNLHRDTDNNADDFILDAPNPVLGSVGLGITGTPGISSVLGAAGPHNTSAPAIIGSALFTQSQFDAARPPLALPNAERRYFDPTIANPQNHPLGVFILRRRFTNGPGVAATGVRYRVDDISTLCGGQTGTNGIGSIAATQEARNLRGPDFSVPPSTAPIPTCQGEGGDAGIFTAILKAVSHYAEPIVDSSSITRDVWGAVLEDTSVGGAGPPAPGRHQPLGGGNNSSYITTSVVPLPGGAASHIVGDSVHGGVGTFATSGTIRIAFKFGVVRGGRFKLLIGPEVSRP